MPTRRQFLTTSAATIGAATLTQNLLRAKAGEADLPDLALLTDRVLLAQGKPQRYGSQFTTAGDGTMELRPTEDMDGLDARRQVMGLQPLAQYKATLSEAYRKPVR